MWSAAYFALQLGAPMATLPSGWLLLGGVLLTTLLLMASLLHLVFAWAHEAERVRWLAPAMLLGGLTAWLGRDTAQPDDADRLPSPQRSWEGARPLRPPPREGSA